VGIMGSGAESPAPTVAFECAVCVGKATAVFEGTIALLVAAGVFETTLEPWLLFAAAELVEAEASELLEVEASVVLGTADWSLTCRGRKARSEAAEDIARAKKMT
jgi:hypothetical protein